MQSRREFNFDRHRPAQHCGAELGLCSGAKRHAADFRAHGEFRATTARHPAQRFNGSNLYMQRYMGYGVNSSRPIVITNIVWCIAYKCKVGSTCIRSNNRAWVLHQGGAMQVGGRGWKDGWVVHSSLEVNEYLVKANFAPTASFAPPPRATRRSASTAATCIESAYERGLGGNPYVYIMNVYLYLCKAATYIWEGVGG